MRRERDRGVCVKFFSMSAFSFLFLRMRMGSWNAAAAAAAEAIYAHGDKQAQIYCPSYIENAHTDKARREMEE